MRPFAGRVLFEAFFPPSFHPVAVGPRVFSVGAGRGAKMVNLCLAWDWEMLLLRFDVLEVVGGWPEAAVRPIPEDAGFECVFDEALTSLLSVSSRGIG
jgi:hypothetical protein